MAIVWLLIAFIVSRPQWRIQIGQGRFERQPHAARLTLNLELLELPRKLGDFVIAHELAHLLAPNHGKVFKSFMHADMPDWQEREQQLQSRSG